MNREGNMPSHSTIDNRLRMGLFSQGRPCSPRRLLIKIYIAASAYLFGIPAALPAAVYPEGWEGLSQYREVAFESILKEEKKGIVLYYIERLNLEGVRFDISSEEIEFDGVKHEDSFICLIDDRAGGIHISSCRSKTGKHTYLNMDLESKPLFNEIILPSEIDYSKRLRNGSNIFLYDTYMPYIALDFSDSFLREQKFGLDDFVASCSGLQDTSRDGFGALDIYHTTTRPHFRGTYGMGARENDSGTKLVEAIHLMISPTEGYRCDEAVTLESGLVIILSEDALVLLDYEKKLFGITMLPISPFGPILFRTIDSDESPSE